MAEILFVKYIRVMTLMLVMVSFYSSKMIAQSNELTDAIFKDYFIIDGHTHDLVKRNGEDPKQAGIDRLEAAGIYGIILFFPLNSASSESIIPQILMDKEFVKKEAAAKNVKVNFVDKFSNAQKFSDSYSLQILMGGEIDGQFSGNLERVDQLKAAGISLVVLDANDQDKIANVNNDRKQFNEFGQKLIKKLNDNNITIDISHLSEELQLETMRLSTKPVIAGHANAKTIAYDDRNISDKVMKILFDQGGVLLLTFCRPYLYGFDLDVNSNGIEKLIEHVDYIAKRYGTDKIGIGTDYGGAGGYTTKDLYDIECFKEIADQLIKRGYSTEQVRQIMGGNIGKFFSDKE